MSMSFNRTVNPVWTWDSQRILRNDSLNIAESLAFATSHRGPWKLNYYEAYLNREDAEGREWYLKRGSGRRFLRAQLRHHFEEFPLRSTA